MFVHFISCGQASNCKSGRRRQLAGRMVVVRLTFGTLCAVRTRTQVCMKSQPLSFFPRQTVLSGSFSCVTVNGTELVSASIPSGLPVAALAADRGRLVGAQVPAEQHDRRLVGWRRYSVFHAQLVPLVP